VLTNAVHDDVGVLEDEPVREAEHGAAEERQPVVARHVASRGREMGRAIGFEDERGFNAEEVDDESPERVLSAKFHPAERTIAQQLPQGSFGGRGRSSKQPGSIRGFSQ